MWHLGFSRLFLSSKELNVKSLIIVLSALRGKKHKIKLLSNSVIVSNVIIISLLIWYRPLLALRHQQSAGKALKEVVSANPIEGGFFCLNPLIVDYQQRQLLLHGVEDLRKAARYSSNQSHTYLLLGRAFCLLGDYESAIPAFQRFAELRPKNPLGYLEMGFALLQACPPNGKCPHGLNTYDAWRNAGVRAEDFLALAEKARQKEDYETALLWYQNAQRMGMELRSTVAIMRYYLTNQKGAPESMTDSLKLAVAIDRGWVDAGMRFVAWYIYGKALYHSGNYKGAEKALSFAKQIYPDNPRYTIYFSEVYHYLGNSLIQQGKLKEGLLYLERALELNPENLWIYLSLGKAYFRINRANLYLTRQLFDKVLTQTNDWGLWNSVINFWAAIEHFDLVSEYCAKAINLGLTGFEACN